MKSKFVPALVILFATSAGVSEWFSSPLVTHICMDVWVATWVGIFLSWRKLFLELEGS